MGGPVGKVAYLAAIAGFVYLVIRRRIPAPLPLLVVAYPFLFAVPTTSFFVGEPRYLLFLAPVLALVIAHVLSTTRRQVLGIGVAFALSVLGLMSLSSWTERKPHGLDLTPGSLDRVLEILDQNDVSAAWARYWIAYRVTFDSEEHVIAGSAHSVRFPPYQEYVQDQPLAAMIVYQGSAQDELLGPALMDKKVRFRRLPAGRFAVYLPDGDINPAELTEVWQAEESSQIESTVEASSTAG